MEITRKIVKQPFAPDTTDVLWLDSSGDSDVLKSFCNGQWKETSTPQQDYIVIKPENRNRSFELDADCLAKIAGALEKNTIFDCLLWQFDDPDSVLTRIIARELGSPTARSIVYYDIIRGQIFLLEIPYTETQYQGLAAIQHAIDEKYGLMQNLPSLEYDGEDNSLNVAVSAQLNVYVCVDGKKIITTVVEGKIKALTLSETGPGEGDDFVNITWEDTQKLIGVAIL